MKLAGYFPFPLEDEEESQGSLEDKIVRFRTVILEERDPTEWRKSMNSSPWNTISKEARLCIGKMLELNPKRRIRISEILQDPFVARNNTGSHSEYEEFE
jgi:serine/threonine protein kinase